MNLYSYFCGKEPCMHANSTTSIGLTKIRNNNLMRKRKSIGLVALVEPKICMSSVKLAQNNPAIETNVLLSITTAIA